MLASSLEIFLFSHVSVIFIINILSVIVISSKYLTFSFELVVIRPCVFCTTIFHGFFDNSLSFMLMSVFPSLVVISCCLFLTSTPSSLSLFVVSTFSSPPHTPSAFLSISLLSVSLSLRFPNGLPFVL